MVKLFDCTTRKALKRRNGSQRPSVSFVTLRSILTGIASPNRGTSEGCGEAILCSLVTLLDDSAPNLFTSNYRPPRRLRTLAALEMTPSRALARYVIWDEWLFQ